jgi:formylglycine-generating enzyme required for sulfatase activity
VTTEEDSAEVAHEALIREWGTLRKWLDEDRESLRLHRHLAETVQEWEQRGKETDELYRGARLKQLQDWAKEHGDALSPLEKEFIRASRVVKKLEQIQWIGIAAAGLALLILVILGITGQLNRFIYRPVNMENYWVTIPAGEFLMGSSGKQVKYAQGLCEDCDFSNEQPQHWIHLSEYKIGKYEVTNEQYNQCIRAGACTGNVTAAKLDHPVVDVNWYAADAYCKWIDGRLPTEAEWEKAASWDDKAGVKSIYPWGDVIDCSFANHIETNNNNTACVNDTTPVGSYVSGISAYGLYDMSGNVWEWVSDWYDESYYLNALPTNPSGPASGDDRVLRGGSWDDGINSARSTFRNYDTPSYAEHFIGFRCVQDVP